MIPLRDENPSATTPFVTWVLVAINVIVFVFELSLGPELRTFIFDWGLVPARLTLALRFGDEPITGPALTVFSSMFLHGGWLHLVGNMWYLWIFGDNIEDTLGPVRFLLFFLLTGLAAGITHVALNPASTIPTVGASGAISGVLGGYASLFPRARIVTLMPI